MKTTSPFRPSVLLLPLAVVACGPSPFEPAEPTTVAVPVPPEFGARVIEDDRLSLDASVDGRAMEAVRGDETWELTMTVAPGSTFDLELAWCYRDLDEPAEGFDPDDDCPLPLASLTRSVSVGERDLRLAIGFDEFRRDFDEDGDGAANYLELRGDFDPRNSNLCPDCRPDVDTTIVRRAVRPVVDGSYFNGTNDNRVDVWSESQLNDRDGRLSIDTLLAGPGTGIGSGDGNDRAPQWGAMHDGRDLFLFVLGEGEPKSRRLDSVDEESGAAFADDDSIEVFIDTPTRSVRLVVPVGDESGNSNVNEKISVTARRFGDVEGANAAIDFATCTCDGDRDFYELRLSLAWLGAASGDVIGLEVQINDDDDGGAVDERWGWQALAGSGRAVDSGSSDGSLPGRALLE